MMKVLTAYCLLLNAFFAKFIAPTFAAMPKTKNAYLRYLLIHTQIKRNKYREGYPSIDDLWRHLKEEGYEVSYSTLEKDLCFLKNDRGVLLEYDIREKCDRYTEDWEFDVPITQEAVRMI